MQELIESLFLKVPQLTGIIDLMKFTIILYAIGMIIEYFFSAEKDQPFENIRFNILYGIVFIIINGFLFTFLLKLKPWLIALVGGPFITLSYDSSIPEQFLHALTYLFIFDFFYYWFHRWQHKIRFFWAQHKLHHSDESLNITTSNRHHWLENPLRVFIIILPMSVLVGFKAETTGVIWSTLMLWGYFIHMNIRLDMGWLTPVFGGPQLHRVHHSKAVPHLDKNFAAFFPIYDIIFKTYYKPAKNEYPTTGLYGGMQMNDMKTANLYPFNYWYKYIKKRLVKVDP